MLAGIGGIDLLLFVVAADESIKPQTREHFDICRLLDIRNGIIVLTKVDLIDRDLLELVKLEVEEFVAGSFLEGAPIAAVSSRTGQGIDELKREIVKLAESIQPKDPLHHFRMPIDRVFVIKGFGTVVTGTLLAGTVQKEAEVEIYPLGRRARVRGIEVHNTQFERAGAGQRTAVNLAGVDTEQIVRGMVLGAPGRFRPTQQLDCRLDLLASARPLKHRAPVHFHTGTAEIEATAHLLEGQASLEPRGRCFAQIRLREPVLVLPGDRFIIRQFSPVVTIGGGIVLDNMPPKHRRAAPVAARLQQFETGEPQAVLDALLASAPDGMALDEVIARTGWLECEVDAAAAALGRAGLVERIGTSPPWFLHTGQFRAALDRVLASLTSFHREHPLAAGAPKEFIRAACFPASPPPLLDALLDRLQAMAQVAIEGDNIRLSTHHIVLKEDESAARFKILAAFEDAGLAVPSVDEVLGNVPVERQRAQNILQMLLRQRTLVRVTDGLVFHQTAIDKLKALLAARKQQSNRLTVPQFKELTGISRKYAIPLLEFLDRERLTRRDGNERIIL
jgi:selenocysteine-specific elongation factor